MQLNLERPPRASRPKVVPPLDSALATKDRQRRYSWTWNVPLLLASVMIITLGGSALAGLYIWQSNRLSTEILDRAAIAERAGDYKDQVKWLTRYVRLDPANTEAVIQLGIATDNAVETNADLHGARLRLSNAIAATGELSAFETQRDDLRHRLIERLLMLGGMWAAEAERQVISLSAPPDDPQALAWMAKAMAIQRLARIASGGQGAKLDKSEDYWKWLAEQPVGLVVDKALERNPDDLELAQLFLTAVSGTPEWFEGSEESPSQEQLHQEANKLCQRLIGMPESGRAQWLAYSFKLTQDPRAAKSALQGALPEALARLEQNLERVDQPTQARESEPDLAESNAIPLAQKDAYQPYWDWQLAITAADQATAESRLTDALAIYQQLLNLTSPLISRGQREATYLAAGQAFWSKQEREKAIEVWQAGAQSLEGSIELAGILVTTLTDLGRTDEAEKALEELDSDIKRQFSKLDGVQGSRLTLAGKEEVRQRLELARWKADVFHGQLQMQRGDFRDASERLTKAFSSPLTIDTEDRIRSGRLLSESYGKQQLWDMAGQILDQCVVLDPTDIGLRRMAAEAWRRLGAPERASAHLETLDDGSFGAALEIARLKATIMSTQPTEQLGLQGVREAIQVARLRWEAMSEGERAAQPIWLLEMLEIAFAEGTNAHQEPTSSRLEALAARYATNPEVQLMALANLAGQKKLDAAKLALRRLQKIAEVSGKPEDAGNAFIAEAIIVEATGDIDGALSKVRAGVAAVPQEALRLAKVAASMAMAHKDSATAYEFLKLVPEEKWDVGALMTAAQIGMASDSTRGPTIADSDFQRWQERLRELEGEDGCHWRYIAAKRLVIRASRTAGDAALLDQARKHFTAIDRLRPRWGMGAALGGQIAALEGSHEEAIALLRRAVRDGDTQVATILLLVSELTAAAQFDQAQQELKRLASLPESIVPTSAWEIALAQRKGDLRAALDLSRKSTARNRNDANAWLVASQTALAVVYSKGTAEEEKTQLRAEAWDALERAASLTEGKDLKVWNARIQFHLQTGDRGQAKHELEALCSSPLPPIVSLTAAANGYMLLQDFESAQTRLKEAMSLDPNAAQPHVAMARILERIGDRQGALSELESAYRLDSENTDIRERLAVAHVLTSEEVPWAEVDRLLANSSSSTAAKSPLLGALLSLERGDEKRVQAAMATLRSLAEASNLEAITAKRLLASQHAKLWGKGDSEERDSVRGRKNFQQACTLYEQLLNTETPAPSDGVAYALLLIEAGQLDQAKQVADRLTAAGTSPLVLQLRLRIAQLQGEDVASIASAWVDGASGFEEALLWEQVGKTMSRLNLNDEALTWFEKAYRKDPARFKFYAAGLAKAGQTDKALELCLSLIEQEGNLDAATLLPEIVLLNTAEPQSAAVEQALATAIKTHADSAPLLEAVATLRLMQERYAESVALYEQADRLAPNRPRTLNNLAIALVELPSRKEAALERINKAIRLYGKHPQFLDTLAIVQSKLGEHAKAKTALEEAIALEKDPRYQLRLVEEHIALGDPIQAKSVWDQIEFAQLKAMALTPVEQRSIAKLSQELGSHE